MSNFDGMSFALGFMFSTVVWLYIWRWSLRPNQEKVTIWNYIRFPSHGWLGRFWSLLWVR